VKFDNEVLEGQVAIEQICTIENPEQKDIYYNFETKQFYI
jgi:adenylate cyclase class IV